LPLSEYVPDVPPALEEIVMKVLSKEPAMRYRTADQLGRVLQKFGNEPAPVKVKKEPISAPPVITVNPEIAERLVLLRVSLARSLNLLRNIINPHIRLKPFSRSLFLLNEAELEAEPIDWITVGLEPHGSACMGWVNSFWAW
jgi:hypothetical protein